ncbi:MAG: histidinol dehydrogenase [Candidatus Binatia bacterium]
MVNRYTFEQMSPDEIRSLCSRSETDISTIREVVRPIIADVRNAGDPALVEYTERFDGVDISGRSLEVSAGEIEAASEALPVSIRSALEFAAKHIRSFHKAQMPADMWFKEISAGVMAGEKITPISSLGLYVPRGKGSFPSVMLMLAIPAVVAGVPEIMVCTPPTKDGGVDAATLYAARISGVSRIFRVGGAQAIAAMAYGTQSVPFVRKVLGPGNQYVSAAKRELYGVIDVGVPAGPSESIILTDGSVATHIVALDLLIEAEHGPDSAALLVTSSLRLADEVDALLPSLIAELPPERKNYCERSLTRYGGIVVTNTFDQAISFVNQFAPEHLEVLTDNPFPLLAQIRNAGELLLGEYTPITLGNFCLGVNAILPTGGLAHTGSCVTVFDYLKRTSIGYVTTHGYNELAPVARTLAEYEGFPSHVNALTKRFPAEE